VPLPGMLCMCVCVYVCVTRTYVFVRAFYVSAGVVYFEYGVCMHVSTCVLMYVCVYVWVSVSSSRAFVTLPGLHMRPNSSKRDLLSFKRDLSI
jgi:hypothetical protein